MEINYKPSEIELIYTVKKLLITGRNLKQLDLFIVAFRVRFIEANIGNDLTDENLLFVKNIDKIKLIKALIQNNN